MNRKIIYVFNPISGTKTKSALLKKIEFKSKEKNLHFELFKTNPDGNYDELRKKIQAEQITDIIIIGGDGTVNQVTNALHSCNVKFGIIPAGSGNGLAFTAGIPKNTDRALQIIFNGKAKQTDAFLVNNYYACMLSGLGFDATVAHKFAENPKRGLTTYARQTVKHFFRAHSYRFEIMTNGFSFFTDAYFISIANSNQFGNNVTIAPKAKLNDGLLDIVIAQKMQKARLPLAVLNQIRGNNKLQKVIEDNSGKRILYFQTPELTIRNFDHAALHIDGEPYETADEFNIKIIKDCFLLIQP